MVHVVTAGNILAIAHISEDGILSHQKRFPTTSLLGKPGIEELGLTLILEELLSSVLQRGDWNVQILPV
jgi:hypothetical protein